MEMAYSPATSRRNIALVLLWTVTLSAFRPRINFVQRASSFQYSLKPARSPLKGPALTGSSKATIPLSFGVDHVFPGLGQIFLLELFDVVRERHDLQAYRRQSGIVQK